MSADLTYKPGDVVEFYLALAGRWERGTILRPAPRCDVPRWDVVRECDDYRAIDVQECAIRRIGESKTLPYGWNDERRFRVFSHKKAASYCAIIVGRTNRHAMRTARCMFSFLKRDAYAA